MEIFQIFVLALVQGITEFLPISSSAHLILIPLIAGWTDQGLAFDVAVHVGTLSAVVLYFRKELINMTVAWFQSLSARKSTPESNLAWAVILGTIPAGIAGLLLKDLAETSFRSPLVIATTTILFGLLLWYSDVKGKRNRNEYSLTIPDILFIGLAQVLALIPGTSRSGITITAALLLGFTREAAARYSFLLSIPLITAGGLLTVKDLAEQQGTVDWQSIIIGAGISGLTAFLCIHYFLKLINKIGMAPFVWYRLLLGFILLYVFI